MFFFAFGGTNFQLGNAALSEEVLEAIPKELDLIYWNYYDRDRVVYDRVLAAHRKLGNPVQFAGGAWRWTGFIPDNRFALEASRTALDACLDAKVKDLMVTAWGDDGGECSIFSVLPTLAYYAERAYGNEDATHLEQAFLRVAGCGLRT